MILGAVFLILANGAVALAALTVLRKVRTDSVPCNVVLFLLFRLLGVSLLVLTAGTAGALRPAGVGLACAAALPMLLLSRENRRLLRAGLPRPHPLAAVIGAVFAARLLLQVWFFAPYEPDALSYHLPKIGEWIRAGSFVREMGTDTHATFPAGFELVETWWVLFLRHDVLIEMAGVEFLVLAGAAVYALASRLGLSSSLSMTAAALYAMTPGVQIQATSCLNDGAVAALFLAAAALLQGGAPLALALVPAFLGAGVKPTFVYALPALIVLAFWRSRPERPVSGGMIAVAGAALLAGSFWYFRNWLWYGNPVHPVGATGLVDRAGVRWIQFGPSWSSLTGNLRALVEDRIGDGARPLGAGLRDISGWGLLGFACAAPALVPGLRECAGLRRLAVAFAAGMAALFLLVMPDPWSMRFVLFFPALPAIALARLAGESRTAALACGVVLAFSFLGTMLPRPLPAPVFRDLAGQAWNTRSMAGPALATVPADEVGYFADNFGIAYLLYRPDFSRQVVYLRSASADELLSGLRRAGLRFVYAAHQGGPGRAVLDEALRTGGLHPVEGRLYEVR